LIDFRDFISIFNLEDEIPQNYREQLYASGRNLLLKFNHMIEITKEKYEISLTDLARNFRVSMKQLRNWRIGKTPIPLRILNTLTELGGIDENFIETEIDWLSSSRGIQTKIPRRISPLLIEILGRFCGDGSCGNYDGDFKWSLKEEGKRFVRLNSRDMQTIFGNGGVYIDYNAYAENLIRSKPLVLLFQQIFEYTDDFDKTYDIFPPYFLEQINWNYRKFFTTGLIDTEGSFYYSNKSFYFELHMVNESLVDEVSNAFNEYRIPYNRKQTKMGNFKLISYGRANCSLISDIFEIKNEKHLKKLIEWDIL
jgi:hypothetical protein